MQIFKKLLSLLTPHDHKRAALLLFMTFVMALLDMIGVASILPFITVMTNPGLIETNFILITMFKLSSIFGVENNQQFLFALGVFVFIVLVFSLTFKALTTYVQFRFVVMREYSIGKRLVEGYLRQPYTWFLNRHSADLGKTVLSELSQVVIGGMYPLIELISKSMISIAILFLLIIADPKLALIVGISLTSIYGIIFYLIRNYLNLIGKKRLENNQIRFTSLSEVFGAIKEIKLKGFGEIFVKHFADSAYIFAKTQATYKVINVLPRFLVEIVSFGGMLLILLYIMFQKGTFIDALPIITLYVFAAYRLMPALQQIYSSITQLTFIGPSVDSLYNDFKNLKSLNANQEDQNILSFNENITLKNVNFNYPETSKASLIDINLSIPSRSTVGLIGTTGSGKTTAIDIILGLLEPQNGTLEVDGHIITQQNLRSWQNSIGYVPQHIYLMDNSVAANIAFGINPKEIDQKAVEKAAKIANLHDFVTNELPKQYQTTIGENGSRLSGGQRQRIGIARALYHNPQVLILDEATSALDNESEKLVMDAIYKLNKKITIILIAHRLNTLKNCDIVFKMDQGKIIDQGNFDKLINNNSF